MSRTTQVRAVNVSFAYGPRTLLTDIDLLLAPGDRIGIVGANGTGKSTLLRLLASELEPVSGSILANPPAATVGLMHQQLAAPADETIGNFLARVTGTAAIVAAFEDSLIAVSEGIEGADDRYDRALEQYVATDAAAFGSRARQTLDDVGLVGADVERTCGSLSGGQRTKLNLAAILLASFDVLLLDEPTNDLDRVGLALLEARLVADERPIAVVSHDRAFLERVVTSVYEIDAHTQQGTRFNGGFRAWQEARDVERRRHLDAYDEYNAKRADLADRVRTRQSWSTAGVRRAKNDDSEPDKNIRAKRIASSEKVASKARQAERALERLERNERVDAPWKHWELKLDFAAAARPGAEIAALHGATVELGDFTLGPVDVLVESGDRIMITGENGSGKTTLLRALLGEVELSAGSRRFGPSVVASTLAQQRALFAGAPSLLRGFTDATGLDDPDARSQLAKLGLSTEQIMRPVAELSPGEQTRAALGLFAAKGANLLVLDEPTNHLDLPAIEQLESAIESFPHTLLLVTHDRRLIEKTTTTRRWHLVDGRLVDDVEVARA